MSIRVDTKKFVVDDLSFEVRRSTRRTSVQITVDRGGELVLSAPDVCSNEIMADFVREKRFWIYTKLAEKERVLAPKTQKQFVTGEDFQYLGRHYRLLLVDEQSVAVKLEAGRFKLRKSASHDGKKHMKAWYSKRGQSWLRRRAQGLSQRVGVEAEINVRDLGYRWGSCTAQGEVKIHWRTMLLPPTVIDYILVHELVHIHEPHHGPEFWTRVERAMPDFARRKQWLAENGGYVGAGL